MKIVVDDKIPDLTPRIRAAHPEIELIEMAGGKIGAADVRDADALIVRTRTRCDASLLEGSAVRLAGTATIGTDHIDTAWCAARGILTVSAPGCNAPAVMQYVACALHAAGFDPARHTLGVVGKGNIGGLVTDLYRKAGGRVLVCDPPRAEAGHTDEDYLPLEALLEQADAVTLHVPGGDSTRGLINPGNLTARNRILVNASRGGVVDPQTYLLPGHTFIIDTWPFEEEGKKPDSALIARAFIATPHIAGYSREGKERATRSMIEALNQAFGLRISTDGLADYGYQTPPLETVLASYDPLADSEALKRNPHMFETLRNNYKLR